MNQEQFLTSCARSMNLPAIELIFNYLPKSGAEVTRTPNASRLAEGICIREAFGVRACLPPLCLSMNLVAADVRRL